MPFLATATVKRSDDEQEEYILPVEDDYDAIVDRIEPFETVNYNDKKAGIPNPRRETHARIVWRITEACEFTGATADSIFNPSLNESSKLYPVFVTLAGFTPEPGQTYDLEKELIGKPCRVFIKHRLGKKRDDGLPQRVFANVESVLPRKRKKAAAPAPLELNRRIRAQVLDDDDDDDLPLPEDT